MYTNAKATLYSYQNGSYARKFLSDVFWDECKQSNIIKSGLVNSDSTLINIPYSELITFTQGKDIIVKGDCAYIIDNTSQQTISAGLKYLKDNCNMLTVMVADLKDFGSKDMWHYELSCK